MAARLLNRASMLRHLESGGGRWDIVIIGGGATGVGCAIDAASRGYRTLLLEQADFAQGTSSRSTKLAHGGVRYLQQGNIALVLDALRERGRMRANAPHLVRDLAFVVPNYDWWEAPFYGIGLRVYDMLAGKHGFGKSRNLSKQKTLALIPTIETGGLIGGVVYYAGQCHAARLLANMAQPAAELGATVINQIAVTGLELKDGFICGVSAIDRESGREYAIGAKVVINAAGPFCDAVRQMEDPAIRPMIVPSQGVHLVLDRSFLPGESAIMVPHTDDGRVLFAIPWHDRTLVGTTDTPIGDTPLEPRPLPEEIEVLLKHAARYLSTDPTPADVRSVFAGIRPLVGGEQKDETAAISRDHTVNISRAGLVTIAGGKWTTYRKMAEDTVDQAATLAGLDERPCVTTNLNIHGYHHHCESFGALAQYGSDAPAVETVLRESPAFGEPVHPKLPVRTGEVAWAARHEMARTVEDVLSRRTRALLMDARAASEAAPRVAEVLAKELGRNAEWRDREIEDFTRLAGQYMVG